MLEIRIQILDLVPFQAESCSEATTFSENSVLPLPPWW
jgi:hypothetical protein